LPNFANQPKPLAMKTMNIFLPATLKQFVDAQVSTASYDTSCEYVRQPIRRDQEREPLCGLLLLGAQSAPSGLADDAYFAELRSGINKRLNSNK
jgi:antitoxin ParD1/3/4